ncbi:hypothetical protein ACFQ3Z_40350 [Streptomyces nogalater]
MPDRWRGLREAGPVRYDETQGVWQVLDHASVATVLADPATYSSDLSALTPAQPDFETFRQGNFVGMDPPRHRTLRTLVSQAFTPGSSRDSDPGSRPSAPGCWTPSPTATGSTWSTRWPTRCRSSSSPNCSASRPASTGSSRSGRASCSAATSSARRPTWPTWSGRCKPSPPRCAR